MYLTKGMKIKASWLERTNASLAGVRPKFGAKSKSISGTIKSVRGNNPVNPTEIMLIVNDGEQDHWIKPEWVTDVID